MSATSRIILVDTNVWLDQYLPDRPHGQESRAFIDYALKVGVNLVYPISALRDVFYLVGQEGKQRARSENGVLSEADARAIQRIAWGAVDNMSEVGTLVGADCSDAWVALKWRNLDGDLEDNLVRAAAQRSKADLVVTWDKGMLSKAVVPTVTPTDALTVMEAW